MTSIISENILFIKVNIYIFNLYKFYSIQCHYLEHYNTPCVYLFDVQLNRSLTSSLIKQFLNKMQIWRTLDWQNLLNQTFCFLGDNYSYTVKSPSNVNKGEIKTDKMLTSAYTWHVTLYSSQSDFRLLQDCLNVAQKCIIFAGPYEPGLEHFDMWIFYSSLQTGR